jgi:hypothetical protein
MRRQLSGSVIVPSDWVRAYPFHSARIAQLVEHLICNQEAVGSSPTPGSCP